MVPMFWLTQKVELDDTLAAKARVMTISIYSFSFWLILLFVQLAVMLPDIGVYASYGIVGLGAILLIFGITLTLTNKWNPHRRFQNDSDNELER